MKSGSISGLEEENFHLGPVHRFMPQAWILSSEASISTIRNALVQKMGKIDTLFIVDAAHDKAAWFNFGPESDARIRRMWSHPVEHQGVEKKIRKPRISEGESEATNLKSGARKTAGIAPCVRHIDFR